jgi:hypothetical protein
MNTKTLIAYYDGSVVQDMTGGDSFEIELINGPDDGTRLLGLVGWAGDHWHILMNKNCSDWEFHRRLWHELAHILERDVVKGDYVANWEPDRALIAGHGSKARLQRFLNSDQDKEDRRTDRGDSLARSFLPGLNSFLAEVEGGASVKSALRWRFKHQRAPAATRTRSPAERARLHKAICEKHKVIRFERRPNQCAPIVEFAASELTPAKALADPEIWAMVEKARHLGSEGMAFLAKVLQRRKKYIAWVADLVKAGLITAPSGMAYG